MGLSPRATRIDGIEERMNDWTTARAGRLALCIIAGLFVVLLTMLCVVLVYGRL
jgi:hypothetical protein